MKLLLVFVLLGCLSASLAHGHWNHKKYDAHAPQEEPEPESEDSDETGESEEEGGDSSSEEENDRWEKQRERWDMMLKEQTEPMLRLINQTYHKMLALPPPDRDDSTNNWMKRTQLVKEVVHESKRILFGDRDWHHHHHHHHGHHKGASGGVDWYMMGELVAGILNRLDDEEKDEAMGFFNKLRKFGGQNMGMHHQHHRGRADMGNWKSRPTGKPTNPFPMKPPKGLGGNTFGNMFGGMPNMPNMGGGNMAGMQGFH